MTDERAMRFGYLLSEIGFRARLLAERKVTDPLVSLTRLRADVDEAIEIAAEVSREALDKVVEKE